MSERMREYRFDNVKFFLIFMVVIGHFADDYTKTSHMMRSIFIFIYTFHMPLFLFISGLFHKRYQSDEKLKIEKIVQYLLIAIVLQAVQGIIKIIFAHNTGITLSGTGGLVWFMYVLAAFEILVFLVKDVRPTAILVLAFLTGIFCGYDDKIGDWMYLSRIFVFFPVYLIGYYMDLEKVQKILNAKVVKYSSGIVLLGYMWICWWKEEWIYQYRYLFTGRNPFSAVALPGGADFWDRIFCYILTILISIAIMSLMPDKKIPWVSRAGAKTIQIYFWHRPLLYIIQYTGISILLENTLGLRAAKISYLLLAVMVTVLCSCRIFGHPAEDLIRLSRNKKYIE